jgi:hypothetical protein
MLILGLFCRSVEISGQKYFGFKNFQYFTKHTPNKKGNKYIKSIIILKIEIFRKNKFSHHFRQLFFKDTLSTFYPFIYRWCNFDTFVLYFKILTPFYTIYPSYCYSVKISTKKNVIFMTGIS